MSFYPFGITFYLDYDANNNDVKKEKIKQVGGDWYALILNFKYERLIIFFFVLFVVL